MNHSFEIGYNFLKLFSIFSSHATITIFFFRLILYFSILIFFFVFHRITQRCITALDKTWHPEHFFCAHCGKNFGDEGYHEKAGNAYCRQDFFKLFAPKCSGCTKPIEDNYVNALGGQWHQECFVCKVRDSFCC